MNRYDERPPWFWRHDRDREDHFRENDASGRTAGDADDQPFSRNPYGYYPGQGRPRREWRGREEWRGEGSRRGEPRDRDVSSHPYGQREPYNAREPYDARGASRRSRSGGPWNDDDSRYSESQYGMGRRRSRFDAYAGGAEPEFGEGPFADTSESPRYFGSGYYGDGGASFAGGFDQRWRDRYPGSLAEDTFSSDYPREQQRRYRTGPKGYTRSDERIREDISERLMMADGIDSSEVTVSVKDGRVTLEGTVPVRSMKHSIEDLADYTAGVHDVDNRIRVERPGTPSANPTTVSAKTTKQ
jgi:osmotically-inducible protein OsmY